MKAFVINEGQIKTAGLGLVIMIIAVFIAGYFLGSIQRGPTLKFGELNKSASEENETQKNSNVNFGVKPNDIKNAKNKSDKNSVTIETEKKTNKKNVSKNKADKNKADKKKIVKKTSTNKNTTVEKKPQKNITKKKEAKNTVSNKKISDNKKAKEAKQSLPVNGFAQTLNANNAVAKSDRVYSIQAGMFSSENNANAFIEKLSDKKFDAYISSFVSSSGATKYNVRVGKFAQRDQARELLREFQKSFSSPAYVVISQP